MTRLSLEGAQLVSRLIHDMSGDVLKVRDGGRVVSKAVLVAYAVNQDGFREVLGLEVAQSEMEISWRHFIEGLVGRGLTGVMLVTSDAHTGLKAAIQAVMNGVTWQRCRVHFMRNVLANTPKRLQGFVMAALRQVFAQTSREDANNAVTAAITALQDKVPAAAALIESAEDDVLVTWPFLHGTGDKSTRPTPWNDSTRRSDDALTS